MEWLHAPWRMEYLTQKGEDRRWIFQEIIQSNEDEKNLVLVRAKSCLALLNKFPYSTAHTMIVPYRIIGDWTDLSETEMLELMTLSQRLIKVIQQEFKPDGINLGVNLGAAAGAGIENHLHLHIVPRWLGDHNFMTVVGATRVYPSELPEIWRRLKLHLT
ncbi:MAG: HIT domain-containing protein [Verrucomicrobiae bacterium]|nr:HIT domain-containing protein [Verrucomicrobiae bacterium]